MKVKPEIQILKAFSDLSFRAHNNTDFESWTQAPSILETSSLRLRIPVIIIFRIQTEKQPRISTLCDTDANNPRSRNLQRIQRDQKLCETENASTTQL
jgi:hypothetical protein